MTAPSIPPMVRTEFATTDTDEAHDYLRAAYADHTPRLSGDREGFRFRASATQEDRFGIEFAAHSMEVRTVAAPYGSLLVAHVLGGHLGLAGRRDEIRAGPGEEFLIAPDARMALQWADLRLGIIRLDTAAVTEFAAEVTDGEIRFPLARPLSKDRADYWRSTVRHLTSDFLGNPAAMGSPLIRTEVFRLLAATLIETFPVIDRTEPPPGTVEPSALRRATAFIDEHAGTDIGITEIARAARVSPRSLQTAFRRHLNTTPTAYLRRVRLEGAHLDLQRADPVAGETVAAIATAWGFAHHGRFAVAYRERYGRSPRQTLHT